MNTYITHTYIHTHIHTYAHTPVDMGSPQDVQKLALALFRLLHAGQSRGSRTAGGAGAGVGTETATAGTAVATTAGATVKVTAGAIGAGFGPEKRPMSRNE